MKTTFCLICFILCIGGAFVFEVQANKGSSREIDGSGDALRESLWNGEAYEVGFITLLGSPYLWHDQEIKTQGYLSLALPDGGYRLSLDPTDPQAYPQQCLVGISYDAGKEANELLRTKMKGQNGWPCIVRGRYISLKNGALPNYGGSLSASNITLLDKN
jgi:hypothetical protein